jgi:hypothetical protein
MFWVEEEGIKLLHKYARGEISYEDVLRLSRKIISPSYLDRLRTIYVHSGIDGLKRRFAKSHHPTPKLAVPIQHRKVRWIKKEEIEQVINDLMKIDIKGSGISPNRYNRIIWLLEDLLDGGMVEV